MCRQPSSLHFSFAQLRHPFSGSSRAPEGRREAKHGTCTTRLMRLGDRNRTLTGIGKHPDHSHASLKLHPLADFRWDRDLTAFRNEGRQSFHVTKRTSCQSIMSTSDEEHLGVGRQRPLVGWHKRLQFIGGGTGHQHAVQRHLDGVLRDGGLDLVGRREQLDV